MIQDVLLQYIMLSDRVVPSSSVVASAIGCPPDTYRADSCVHATGHVRRRLPNILQKGKDTNPHLKVVVACVVLDQQAHVALIELYRDCLRLPETFTGGIPDGF